MKKKIEMRRVYAMVADTLRDSGNNDVTAIRSAVNDELDRLDKEGYKVYFNYSQQRAVNYIRKLLAK